MTTATFVCALVFLIASLAKTPREKISRGGKGCGILVGVCMAAANFCSTALVHAENATVLYPLLTAGTLVLTLACGRLLFKEKLKLNHYVAFLLGICSVVFLKL